MTRVFAVLGLSVLVLFLGFAGAAQAQTFMQTSFQLEDFEAGSNLSAANTTAGRVFRQLVGTTAKTAAEEEEAADAAAAMRTPRLFVADMSYERAEFENVNDGQVNVVTVTSALAMDVENVTIGLLIPYDHLDFTMLDMNRIGAILYGQYACDLTPELTATFTANLNYLHTFLTDLRVQNSARRIPLRDNDTYGAGVGAKLELDKDNWVPSLAFSYNYAVDNNNTRNDESHFFKVGGALGRRIGRNFVVNAFAVGNFDASSYQRSRVDTTFVEFGFEGGVSVTDSWKLNLGYKKVVKLRAFESNLVFLGSALVF